MTRRSQTPPSVRNIREGARITPLSKHLRFSVGTLIEFNLLGDATLDTGLGSLDKSLAVAMSLLGLHTRAFDKGASLILESHISAGPAIESTDARSPLLSDIASQSWMDALMDLSPMAVCVDLI